MVILNNEKHDHCNIINQKVPRFIDGEETYGAMCPPEGKVRGPIG